MSVQLPQQNKVKWFFHQVIVCLGVGLTVACQSQPSSVDESITISPASPKASVNPSPRITNTPEATPTPKPTPEQSNSYISQPPIISPEAFVTEKPSTSNVKPTLRGVQPTPEKVSKPSAPDTTKDTTSVTPTPAIAKAPNKPAAKISQKTYENKELGIKFQYPGDYVVEAPEDDPQQGIVVWDSTDYQALKAGKYQNTSSPGNISIYVEPNPNKLPLSEWLKGNDNFLTPTNSTPRVVAGKQGLSFRSTGLFEFENVAVPSPDGSNVIVVSVAADSGPNDKQDQAYQKVFEQVVSTLELDDN
ncbi:MAG: hypothetical protein QNJ47_26775 [Nostocaceae cyanobacterium]|nr:hypothetical protein [Nostocaceae cyanobacterium]